MEQINITLALAIILSVGFLAAKAGNFIKLPSVTGYIIAGLLLGPSGINLIPAETVGLQLGHFTQIALMLIAFGIGEHLEIKRLKSTIKSVSLIGVGEILGAFIFVLIGSFLVATTTNIGLPSWLITEYFVLAILLAAVSVATAPAATLHVIRELKASGPLSTTLMAVVAIDDGLAIMMFGISVSMAHQLMADSSISMSSAIIASLMEIGGSLTLGCIAGLVIDYIHTRLKSQGEMLTAGLAILLLCGESARFLHFSPLLAGMAAGFTIVNRDHRDLRLFRALNSFEPPIYVLFFTLAGIHLNLKTLVTAGWLGLTYFILRSLGKIVGAGLGAKFARAPRAVQKYLGLALVPQAGVAIGLIFLINTDKTLSSFSDIITPVVLAGVVLSELFGPLCTRQAVQLAGETPAIPTPPTHFSPLINQDETTEPTGVPMVPWTWEKLSLPSSRDGVVLFGANHLSTTRALARMAAIFSNYHCASPMAVRIYPPNDKDATEESLQNDKAIMMTAQTEMVTMGIELQSAMQEGEDTAQGILAVARQNRARGIVLGHCQKMTPTVFQKVIGEILSQAPCPTIVIKFTGVLHTEKILVPITSMRDIHVVRDSVRALATVGKHQITLLHLLPSYETEKMEKKAVLNLQKWAAREGLSEVIQCRAMATHARQETVTTEAEKHDLVVMAGPKLQGFQRLFFGSLPHAVANQCGKTLITVYPAAT